MTLRNMLLVNGIALVLFALGMLLVPAMILGLLGFTTGASEKLLGQLVGVELLANGLVSLFAVDVREHNIKNAFILSFFIADGVGFIVSAGGVLSGTMNALGWVIAGAYLLLALGFAYFQFIGPTE
jgi:hypothetical protein